MSVLLPIVLFLSWFAFAIAPAGKLAIKDELNDVPEEKRRGVSIFPCFPVFPLCFWGVAWLIDRAGAPWGSRSILIFHLLLLALALYIIVRDAIHLRKIRKLKVPSES